MLFPRVHKYEWSSKWNSRVLQLRTGIKTMPFNRRILFTNCVHSCVTVWAGRA